MPPTYYRGCWHVVGRGFLIRYRQTTPISWYRLSFRITEFYNPKTFFIHAALLGQAFAHCRKFPTAASRRSLGRLSVPVWLSSLSAQLRIVDLVGRYLTNYLMRRKPLLKRRLSATFKHLLIRDGVLSSISCRFQRLSSSLG